MNSLSDIEIVITRPKAQGEKWRQQLQSLGANTFLIPVLEILPLNLTDDQDERVRSLKTILLKLDEFHKIILVSQNAVSEAAVWIDNYWPQRPVGIEYFAVGSATAAFARRLDFKITAPSEAMNSEDLLALDAMQNVKDQKILICRGVGGRTTLYDELTKRGALVLYGEFYTRQLPEAAFAQIEALKLGNNGHKTVLSAHSGESLENLNTVIETITESSPKMKANIKTLPLLIPGERVAEMAKDLGFQQLIVAKNATDNEMTQALCDWQ